MNQHSQKPDKQQPAITFAQLQQLYRQHVIDADGWRFAKAQWFPLHWQRWITRLCLGLGTALLLIGVVFFFAYNWHAMPKWSKLALLQGTMLACFVSAAIIGPRRLSGQYLLLAGTVFIGMFFAVFGQIYQTGADAWQLFALWAVLMSGFVGVSRFTIQWIVQWTISGLAIFLYLQQALNWRYDTAWKIGLLLGAYSLCLWALQLLLARRYDWLDCTWLRILTLFIGHAWLVVYAVVGLVVNDNRLLLFIAGICIIGLLHWHWRQGRDLLSQVISAAALGILIWALIINVLLTNANFTTLTAVVILFITLGLSIAVYQAVIVLKKHYRDMN